MLNAIRDVIYSKRLVTVCDVNNLAGNSYETVPWCIMEQLYIEKSWQMGSSFAHRSA